MKILVCGANGFIGRHLCQALTDAGHQVVRGVRTVRGASEVAIDYGRDHDVDIWLPRLSGIDAVVNAVGILFETPGQSFESVHRDAPVALFKACEQAGVGRVVQISALGGHPGREPTAYMRTKREADTWLAHSALDWTVLRPSLVVGLDGESSRFFRTLASLPIVGLPGRGEQLLQPVHVNDLCGIVVRLIADAPKRCVFDVPGPTPMPYRQMLQVYRRAMGMYEPFWLTVPMWVMRPAATFASHLPQKVFSPDTLRMLEDGNVADPAPVQGLLGRPLKAPEHWFGGISPGMLRGEAVAAWTMPMLRIVLALVWLVSAALSFGIFPTVDSLELLARVGLHGGLAWLVLYSAAALDAALGVATLLKPSRLLWRLQFGLIFSYTLIISIWLPEFWLHPFGPVLKNLPILALLLVLDAFEKS